MQSISKQRGLTAISWFLIIALAIMVIIFFIRLIPIYIDGYSVKQAVASLAQDTKLAKNSPKAIRKSLLTKFNLNSVYSVTGEDIFVSRQADKTLVEVEYEIRENVLGNLDFVVSFKSEVLLP